MDFTKREEATGHAVCSPSQLYRIMACPGSVTESLKAPIPKPSEYAIHGTMLHDIMFSFLTKKSDYKIRLGALELADRNAIEDALDYVRDLFRDVDMATVKMAVETRVNLADWGMPDVYGTLDLSVLVPNHLHIVDWKFGAGVKVEAFENEQLMAYAAGCISKYNVPTDSTTHKVTLHVVQPFIDHYDAYQTDPYFVSLWVMEKLEPALKLAMSPQGRQIFNPGDKQCRWCPAAMTCRARLNWANEVATVAFGTSVQPAQATKAELARLYKKGKEVIKYISQIEKYIMAELSAGRSFTGFKLVTGRSNRAWVDEKKAEGWLLGHKYVKEGDLYTKKFISPAQAEKIARHLKKDPDFQKLVNKPDGNPVLASEDDKREAIKPNEQAVKAFSDWQGSEED